MFAGKTTALIARIRAFQNTGGTALVIKPSWDTRYHALPANSSTPPAELVSHEHDRLPAFAASSADEVSALLAQHSQSTPRERMLLVIDEAHFFGAPLAPIIESLLAREIDIIIAGVEVDHFGEPFEPFPTLLAHADQVIKLASRCSVCNQPARHSQRLTPSNARIEVGGSELYEPRCRACFNPQHAARP